jgi:hypothetical protein
MEEESDVKEKEEQEGDMRMRKKKGRQIKWS